MHLNYHACSVDIIKGNCEVCFSKPDVINVIATHH